MEAYEGYVDKDFQADHAKSSQAVDPAILRKFAQLDSAHRQSSARFRQMKSMTSLGRSPSAVTETVRELVGQFNVHELVNLLSRLSGIVRCLLDENEETESQTWVEHHGFTDEEKEMINSCLDAGMSCADISKKMGCPYPKLYGYVRRHRMKSSESS
jgi:hypothetical protein